MLIFHGQLSWRSVKRFPLGFKLAHKKIIRCYITRWTLQIVKGPVQRRSCNYQIMDKLFFMLLSLLIKVGMKKTYIDF